MQGLTLRKNYMTIKSTIFRPYDIRGIYPQEFNEDVAYRVSRSFCQKYRSAKKIIVAQDTRLSSPIIANAIIRGLVDAGKQVIDIGIAPDPLFYFMIFNHKLDGGIMISASHNPKEYNGLMLSVKKPGAKMVLDIINDDLFKLRDLVLSDRKWPASRGKIGKVIKIQPEKEYLDYVARKIKLARPLKIVIDSSNGACGFLPEKIFKKLGCDVKTINGEFDGTFPNHLPDPYLEENLSDIKKAMRQYKADCGFCFDTDGDRVALIDERDRSASGDFCMLMLAREVLKKKKGPIIHDMRISKAVLDELAKQKVPTFFSICHHNAVIEEIIKRKAVFGGEITLHFLFPLDYYLCDDAVFAALKLAEVVSRQSSLAKYIDSLPYYPLSPEIFVDVPDDKKYQMIADFVKYLRKNNYDFVDVDGARINLKHGWALMRASNTGPMIKCRFEADTKEHLLEIEKEMLGVFTMAGLPITEKLYQDLGLR